jgi:rhodanese-related sulfurtransferase
MWRIFILLSISALIFSACGSKTGKTSSAAQVKDLMPDEFKALGHKENAIVLDVRTPGEIDEGYIDGADLFIDYNGCCFNEEIAKLDKNKTYLVYCRSGGRSCSAADLMVKNGFKEVYNLKGGIKNWNGNVVR